MIKFRTKFSLILATFASFLIINTAFADAAKPFEQFYDPFPGSASDLGWLHVSWDDSQIGGIQNSYLVGVKQDLNKTGISVSDFSFCTSALDERCRNADTKLFNAALQECKSNTDFNCIESFSARLGQGSWIEGKFDRTSTFGSVRFFTGDESQGIPNGGGYSIWHFDGISHDGGNGFLLRTEIQNESYGKSTPRLFAQITPISSTVGNFRTGNITASIRQPDRGGISFSDNSCTADRKCTDSDSCFALFSSTECLLAWPHPKSISYQLVLRLNSDFASFMQGRLQNAMIEVQNHGKYHTYKIEAEPILIPVLQSWVKDATLKSETFDHLDKFYRQYGPVGKSYSDTSLSSGQWTKSNLERIPYFYDQYYFDEYNLWLKEFADKATGRKSIWQFRSLYPSELSNTSKCISGSKDFTGLVSSNAGAYIASPPTFNTATDSLDYKVASAHFDENGNEFIGNYRFVIRQDVARCIYGFSSGPIKATVSVTSANGENQTSSTSTLEKDGWLYFNASGFTFSSPTIKVKLSQDAPAKVTNQSGAVAPTPIQPTTVEKSKTLSKTITCIKGKNAKKVSGVNPKCPTGYKLK